MASCCRFTATFAQERAETQQKLVEREEEERRTGKRRRGSKPEAPNPEQARPDDTAQRNITDPESRIMLNGGNNGRFVQGYNAQIAANLDRKPEKVSADTGYFSEPNVTDESVKDTDQYVATGRDKHGSEEGASGIPPDYASPKEAIRQKLRNEVGVRRVQNA